MKKIILLVFVLIFLLSSFVVIPINQSIATTTDVPSVLYSSHLQDIGWEKDFSKKDGQVSGRIDETFKMEAIKIKLDNVPNGASISYKVHMENEGWKSYVSNGAISGTVGKNLKVEAIRIKINNLDNYDVIYRAYVEGKGWQEWVKNDEIAGTTGKNLRLYAFQIKILPKAFGVKYYSYIEGSGWENIYSKQDGQNSGTTGKNLKLEALKIKLDGAPEGASITYQTHLQDLGWQNLKEEGDKSGIEGRGLKIEAIKIKLTGITGYSVQYRTHVQDIGWLDWVSDGVVSGTIGKNLKIEALQIRIISNNSPYVAYSSHLQDIGWEEDFSKVDGTISGTTGKNLKIEAVKIKLINEPSEAKISYQTYIQNSGWQSIKENGIVSGTTGRNLKVEAIKIKLEGLDGYTIRYRVHVQDIGWQNWVKSDQIAGVIGKGLKIEAIQIEIIPKDIQDAEDAEDTEDTENKDDIENITIKSGIDVSHHQGIIDWSKVKQDGIDFAIIRAGYRGWGISADGTNGKLVKDSKFDYNAEQAIKNGIPIGAYFFSQAINEKEAIEEANFMLSIIKNYNITYPVIIDVEYSGTPNNTGRADNISKEMRTKICDAFLKVIENAGYTPMIYADKYFVAENLDMSKLSSYSFWLAHYTGATQDNPFAKPSDYNGTYKMWQYTSKGTVDGISTSVDMNIWYM